MIDPSARVHPTADLEADVTVGPGTSIWHRAQVRTGARIGAECVIGGDAFIDEGVDHRRPGQGPERRARLPRRDRRGRRVHRARARSSPTTASRAPITPDGDLARADDWTVSPIHLGDGCSIGAGAVVVAGCDVGPFATGRRRRGRHPRRSRRTRSSSATPPAASAGCAPAASGSTDSTGHAGAGRPRALRHRPRAALPGLRPALRLRHRRRGARRAHRPVRPAGSRRMIPVARPDIGPEEIAAVTEVLAERDARRRPHGSPSSRSAGPRSSARSTRSRSATGRSR